MNRATLLLAMLLLSLAAYGQESTGDAKPIRRYGLFIGANDGGPERARLVFAESDSRAMVRVMQEVGGLDADDAVVLSNPSAAEVRRRLGEISARIERERSQARRVEFLLYYSGHSDEEALMLGSDRFEYGELRDEVRDLGADISIAILDSCASGAFIRIKGGQRRPAFLVDESSAVQGQVYLTSSSEDEASQESDTLGGSFFTHALVSAMRGAADFSLDGKVTLHEAYQYASSETLARTENTQAGPQHPSWYINLNGTGDLVLTDLRSTSAGLTMSEDITGKVYIRDDRGKLIAEVRKSQGVPLTLALPPGSYAISSYTEERTLEARIVLRDGKWSSLAGSDFRESGRVATRARGDSAEPERSLTDRERARELVQQFDEGFTEGFFDEIGQGIQDRVRKNVEAALDRVQGAAAEETAAPEPTVARAGGSSSPGVGAAEPEVPLVPFSFGLVPGLSFPFTAQSRKVLSLNALIGVSHSIQGFEASGIMNLTSHDVRGGQVAGIGNIVAGELRGVQSAVLFNILEGEGLGVQTSGVFSLAKRGGTVAQVSGVFSLAGGRVQGGQISGVWNGAPEILGAQVGGVFNLARMSVDGMQVAGVVNVAGKVRGAQIGVVNVSPDTGGVQVGVVNSGGRMRGLQIGLLNISRSLKGLPIGIVNLVGDGLMLASLSWDERGFTTAEFASGSWLYTVLSGGVLLSADAAPLALSGQLGLGVHLALGSFFVSADLTARSAAGLPGGTSFVLEDAIPFPSLRARAGMLLFGRVGGYVGYAADVHLGEGFPVNTVAHTGKSVGFTAWDQTITLYPRFVAGISVGRQPD